MKESIRNRWPVTAYNFLFRTARPLEKESSLFILVSALDFFMTYLLLIYSGGGGGTEFYESNPVARFFYERWDVYGLVGFKFGAVATVAVFAQIIATERLRAARWLLNFATMLIACVVIYSLSLLLRHSPVL